MLVYVTCPAVAAAYGRPLGFNIVSAQALAFMVENFQGYALTYPHAFPRIGYCDPLMPSPNPGTGTPPPAPPPPAPPPPPPGPPPAPAPQTITVGPEDTLTKVDVDGDGRPDVLVVVDRPPQNP